MNKINDNRFNATDENNLASVYELISTYGMEAMPQAMEILFNEAMLIERSRSSKLLSVNSHLSYQIHPYQSIQKLIITQRQVSLRTLPFI